MLICNRMSTKLPSSPLLMTHSFIQHCCRQRGTLTLLAVEVADLHNTEKTLRQYSRSVNLPFQQHLTVEQLSEILAWLAYMLTPTVARQLAAMASNKTITLLWELCSKCQ